MFWAINKTTNKKVKSTFIFKDPEYQFPRKDKWIAPEEKIINWDELKEKGIEEVEVTYVSEGKYVSFRGKKVKVAPHFRILKKEKLGIKTIKENKWHRIAENWIYNRVKNEDLELIYSTSNKPHKYSNSIMINELPLDYTKWDIEVIIQGGGIKRIADVIFPFHTKHPFFGDGIVFEIQFSKQKPALTERRTFDRTLQGYSVVWLHEKDFEKVGEDLLELKENKVIVFTFASEIRTQLPKYIRNLKWTIQEQTRLLEEKKENIFNEIDDKLFELKALQDEFVGIKDKTVEEVTTATELVDEKHIAKFAERIKKEVAEKINNTYFEDNKDEIDNIIEDKVQRWLRLITLDYIRREVLEELDISKIIDELNPSEILNDAKEKAIREVRDYYIQKEIIQNPPTCPKCDALMKLQWRKDKTSVFWGCTNYPDCKGTINIDPNLKKRLLNIKYD